MNQMVKRLINSIEEEDQQEGTVPNRTMYLGHIMAAINAMEQCGKNGVSAYEAGFGVPYCGVDNAA
jgi:hypothetical protein